MTHTPAGILVVANRTCPCPMLLDEVARRVGSAPIDVLVVVPALNSRLRHYMSDSDHAERAAEDRLAGYLARLRAAGVRATGHVGDADPLLAMEDAMAAFPADEILIGTHPEHRSNWLARDIVARACGRFGLPVAHVVVDAVAHQEYLAA